MYPSLFRRVGATLIDLAVLFVTAYFIVTVPLNSASLGVGAGGWHRVYPRKDLRAIHDITADTLVVDARKVHASAA
jgi:uncharacterized RDD family membrane protein YckC